MKRCQNRLFTIAQKNSSIEKKLKQNSTKMENTLKKSSEDENMANFQVLPMAKDQDLQVYEEIEDQRSVVPFHRHESSLNWRMLAAILVVVSILGASIFTSGQEEISPETIPITRRLLDWTSMWSNADENLEEPRPHHLDQLVEYSFFVLWAYCGSEVLTHLMYNNEHNFF